MTPEAKEILIKYISIIGSECEHDSYCNRRECNKLGYIFCCVDYAKAKFCAIEEVKAVELALTDFGRQTDYLQGMDRTFAYYEKLLTEIEKL